ncbi:hypothetical protein [Marinoscillum pacificum]|uniref:hypothetical protein n=1 Tax=Marinoscillum pacificum TaxID=392723 RepID=UPI0021583B84|nr:hypothetical protein [Marinoscillum pacificum]
MSSKKDQPDILEKLVKQILIDLIEAQNQANIKSAKLAKDYFDHKVENLQYFGVPNSLVKSFDFTLKFMFEDLVNMFNEKTKSQFKQLIKSNWRTFVLQLLDQEIIQESDLAQKLKAVPDISINVDQLEPQDEDLLETISSYLIKQLEAHAQHLIESQKCSFSKENSESLKNEVQQIIDPVNIQESASSEKKKMVIDLNQLNKMDQSMICEIKVHADMQTLKWGYSEKFEDPDHEKDQKRMKFLVDN